MCVLYVGLPDQVGPFMTNLFKIYIFVYLLFYWSDI